MCDNPSPPPPFPPLKPIAIELKGEGPTRGREGRGKGGEGEGGTSQNTTAHPAYAME